MVFFSGSESFVWQGLLEEELDWCLSTGKLMAWLIFQQLMPLILLLWQAAIVVIPCLFSWDIEIVLYHVVIDASE